MFRTFKVCILLLKMSKSAFSCALYRSVGVGYNFKPFERRLTVKLVIVKNFVGDVLTFNQFLFAPKNNAEILIMLKF